MAEVTGGERKGGSVRLNHLDRDKEGFSFYVGTHQHFHTTTPNKTDLLIFGRSVAGGPAAIREWLIHACLPPPNFIQFPTLPVYIVFTN